MIADALPRSLPEDAGVDPGGIAAFVRGLDDLDQAHSYLLLRHGTVIAEGWWAPYAPELRHSMFSVSKSFTSTAVGFAIAEGLLSLDDRVVDLLPDDLPDVVSPALAAMQVRHLLTMTTGHAVDTVESARLHGGDNWARAVLAQPVEFEPGAQFVYNSGATYLLSTILHARTGMRLLDYLTPRLLAPLGITGATWEQCPRGIDAGGWGLAISTEELAAFGQLLLQHGQWKGSTVVPREWLDEATRWQVSNAGTSESADSVQGYGYQFWRSRHGAYRGDGAFGQLVVVLEAQDAVLVTTGGIAEMQLVLDLAWTHLLPAFDAPITPEAVPAALALPTPEGTSSSARAVVVAGRSFTTDDAAAVQSFAVTSRPDTIEVTIGDAAGTHVIECGVGRWVAASTGLGSGIPTPIAASAAWDGDTLHAIVQFVETPFAYRFRVTFTDDAATVDLRANVSFGLTHLGRVELH